MKLGIFDSGLGGLTVVKAIRSRYPSIDIQYLGDTARVPYGGRSPDVIVRYAFECFHFLTDKNQESKPDAIIVACNTVSAIALTALREQNEVPVLGVIDPAARSASRYTRVGLLATKATVESKAYETALKSINPNLELFAVPSPLLVPMVEEGWHSALTQQEVLGEVVRHYLKPLVQSKVEAIILGCTHYPLLKHIIEDELKKMDWSVPLISSDEELAKELHIHLNLLVTSDEAKSGKRGELKIYTTDEVMKFHHTAESYLSEPLNHVLKAEL